MEYPGKLVNLALEEGVKSVGIFLNSSKIKFIIKFYIFRVVMEKEHCMYGPPVMEVGMMTIAVVMVM
jgi:hypothetical protein